MAVRSALVLLALLLATPAAAQSLSAEEAKELLAQREISAHPAECARLRRQIDHFTYMLERAEALDSAEWSERMEQQVELLRGIQAARCPNDVPVDTAAEAFAQLMKLAAKGAVAYFTFGAAGF